MTTVRSMDELWELRDRRVDGWFLLDSWTPVLTICAAYVLLVKVILPAYMKDREPYEFKKTIMAYNLLQVIGAAYVVWEAFFGGWGTHYNFACQGPDYTERGMRMASITHFYYLLKYTEFFDTFFFIARKKYNQVTVLHVFHHGIMPLYAFTNARFLPTGHETFGGLLNSLVHVIMYSYYFLSGLGPHMQPYLWWKKYLTQFQIIQFVTILVRSCVVLFGFRECGYPWQHSLVSVTLITSFLVLFLNFYIRQYMSKKAAGITKKKA